MILEQATLNVRPGQEIAFEIVMKIARLLVAPCDGLAVLKLRRCVGMSIRYLLSVRWATVEDHTVGFRTSDRYQKWRELLHHFYDPAPLVEHYGEEIDL